MVFSYLKLRKQEWLTFASAMKIQEKKNLRHLSLDEIKQVLEEQGEKSFRATQVWEWIWQKGAASIDDMSNLSKELREKLKENFDLYSISVDTIQRSSDGVVKVRFKTSDNFFIEGVLIPAIDRITACVSSQVGCSLTCTFCATGLMDRERNLTHDEIFDQVVQLNKISEEQHSRRLTNIVFMGMGEPLLNYSNVIKAIDKISAPDGLVISPRRITVSTAGISKMIRKLADDKVRFRLALSLHAADDQKRSRLMPINQENNLESLTESLQYFWEKTGNRISFEYVLFEGVNDTLQDAKNLVTLCKKFQLIHVNLIEYNRVQGVPYKGLSFDKMEKFAAILEGYGLNATIRRSRGRDIDAACGQLANKK